LVANLDENVTDDDVKVRRRPRRAALAPLAERRLGWRQDLFSDVGPLKSSKLHYDESSVPNGEGEVIYVSRDHALEVRPTCSSLVRRPTGGPEWARHSGLQPGESCCRTF
jgi:hypothetical protein